jgi:hypothetical protein
MTSGPDHYREAEAMQRRAEVDALRADLESAQREWLASFALRAARNHALLAIAAAVGVSGSMARADEIAWRDVAGSRLDSTG